jgi:hypothetical protein
MVEALKDLPWFEVDGHEKLPPRKLPKFSGALRTPIVQSLANQPMKDEVAHINEAMSSILRQRIEKLILLLKHYNLEDKNDPWLLLSLRLACAFVPGLQVLREAPRRRGRPKGPKKWTAEAHDELIAAVKAVRAEKVGRTIASSIQILKKRDPTRWRPLNEARYYEALRDRKLHSRVLRALTTPRFSAAPKKECADAAAPMHRERNTSRE